MFLHFSTLAILSRRWQKTVCLDVHDFLAGGHCSCMRWERQGERLCCSSGECVSILLRWGERRIHWGGDGVCDKVSAGDWSDALWVAREIDSALEKSLFDVFVVIPGEILFVLRDNHQLVVAAWLTKKKICPCKKFFLSVLYGSYFTQRTQLHQSVLWHTATGE